MIFRIGTLGWSKNIIGLFYEFLRRAFTIIIQFLFEFKFLSYENERNVMIIYYQGEIENAKDL